MYQYKLIKYRLDISNNNLLSQNWINVIFRKVHNISIQFDIFHLKSHFMSETISDKFHQQKSYFKNIALLHSFLWNLDGFIPIYLNIQSMY